jgi:hypothetical protein
MISSIQVFFEGRKEIEREKERERERERENNKCFRLQTRKSEENEEKLTEM